VARAATAPGNESDGTSSEPDIGHYVFAADGFTCDFEGPETKRQAQKQLKVEERERTENATRLSFLNARIEQLEEQARLTRETDDRKPAAREPRSHPPRQTYSSYSHGKKPSETEIRKRQAQAQAKTWAESRKPNPRVWASPANQRSLKEAKQASLREKHQADYELRAAKQALVNHEQQTVVRQRQLNNILAEFQHALARAERHPTEFPPRPLTQPNRHSHREESSDESRKEGQR
jgi:hypothetical protein